ncbi:hypothetical protein D1007_42599 [Hordeum vulgare]|nr:hypothetical protein D1007_42599 [Hordeum vulgare]KAI4984158.1 hypothetical protein ZWY2020_046530 [Hordeum vulgare]
MVRIFFNDERFDIKITPKPPNHVSRLRFSDDGSVSSVQGGNDDYRGRHRCSRHSVDDPDSSEDSCSPLLPRPYGDLHISGWGAGGLSRWAAAPSAGCCSHPSTTAGECHR